MGTPPFLDEVALHETRERYRSPEPGGAEPEEIGVESATGSPSDPPPSLDFEPIAHAPFRHQIARVGLPIVACQERVGCLHQLEILLSAVVNSHLPGFLTEASNG
jgi:hypothetical protein